MATSSYTRWFLSIAATVLLLCCSGSVQAGWVSIKNDTNRTLVVQENVVVNGQTKRGKPINLLPGETLREYLPGPTIKKIELFESHNPNEPVWSGSMNCKDEKQTFSITMANDKLAVEQVICPAKKQ